MKKKKIIELGSTVRCVVSGFTGIAIARAEHIHLCDRYTVQPPVGADGKVPGTAWIDGHALVVLAPPSEEIKKSVAEMVELNRTEEKPGVGGPLEEGNASI